MTSRITAYDFVIREPFHNGRIKLQFENIGRLRTQVIEQAIMMIPGVDKSRPFINPFNGMTSFVHDGNVSPQDVLAAMRDNIRCILVYSRFVDSMESL
jgi:hypothetical protein